MENVLNLSGNNRPELEKILSHYSENPADSLKYRAAVFLIENMSAHYSYTDDYMEKYCAELDSLSSYYKQFRNDEEATARFHALAEKYSRKPPIITDLQTVKAQYMIENIDHAFALWEKCEWLNNIEFDEFCEYLLPYKVAEVQALDDWRTTFSDAKYGDLQYLNFTNGSALRAAGKVNSALISNLPSFSIITPELPSVRKISTLLNMLKIRDCEDHVYLEASAMRAKGIPVAIDFTPLWPDRGLYHSWCVLHHKNGKNIPFNALDNEIYPYLNSYMAKAYRTTFSVNIKLVKLNRSGEQIWPLFRNLCMKDVTDEYTNTVDIEVPIEKSKKRYAYLCLFDDKNWQPVGYGTIKGKRARFEKVGRDIIYLVATLEEDGLKPVSMPFLLDYKGEIKMLEPETEQTQNLRLTRKHPAMFWLDTYGHRTIDGRFQAATKADFSDSVTLAVITKFGTETDEFMLPKGTKYRYWRFLSAPEGWGHISEVYYIKDGKNIAGEGKAIGVRGKTALQKPENLYDNDPLTCYEAPVPTGGWSGLDFGKEIEIERILYIPRADGNNVTYGDEYELSYWEKDGWRFLGKKTAESVYIDFDNCPVNALFLLHDITRGVEDRPFTYQNGKQVWW
ncbi:MAG: hypothetical protein LBR13_01380 [Dysgonamonadaceae bacterium]|nr:hypothetical protein [Dysgonamonadaceae bacterium]